MVATADRRGRPLARSSRAAAAGQVLAAVLVAGAAAGCSPAAPVPTGRGREATTTATARVVPTAPTASPSSPSLADGYDRSIDRRGRRTDLEPLTKRFTAIGTPEKVVWYSGTLGSDRVPGPSTYWIDAVVTLDETTAARLRDRVGPLRPVEADVVDPLRAELPQGPFQGSPALNAALVGPRFTSRCALAADGRTLVLRALGK